MALISCVAAQASDLGPRTSTREAHDDASGLAAFGCEYHRPVRALGGRFGLDRLRAVVLDPRLVPAVYLSLAVLAGVQQLLLGARSFEGRAYTHYNNFVIFKSSFQHLLRGQDLYVRYPAEHWDLFKYSPTFAAFMAPFAFLPDAVGLLVWNLLNVAVLFIAIRKLPLLDERAKALLGLLLVPELLTSLQNSQCNVLVVGLLVLAFESLERERAGRAALLFVCAFYIKIFGLLAAVLFLLYPRKGRFLLWAAGWLVLLGVLPLLLVSPDRLQALYGSWARLLAADHSASTGLSVMGWIHSWFGFDPPKPLVVAAGAALGLAPLVQVRAYRSGAFRMMLLASVLIWVIVFNHKAESATYIIAMCGVGLWYFSRPRGPAAAALLALAFVLTSLSPTDLVPRALREEWVKPYALKAVPCILVWLTAIFELASFPRAAASGSHRQRAWPLQG